MPLIRRVVDTTMAMDEESGAHHTAPGGGVAMSPLMGEENRKPSIGSLPKVAAHNPTGRPGSDLTLPTSRKKQQEKPPPILLHPILHKVPMHVRFGINGFFSNVLFMVAYNAAVQRFENVAASSTIYSVVYLIFIPVSHAIISLLVFGWPERYVRSLMSNAPVGLTAIVLGASLTAYLDRIEFNVWVAEAVAEYWRLLGYQVDVVPSEGTTITPGEDGGSAANSSSLSSSGGAGEFYSSIFVLIVTSIWTFVLSVMVNAPAESLDKKEL